jgi:hypothetical protein
MPWIWRSKESIVARHCSYDRWTCIFISNLNWLL